jgi:hypothetical protein
MKERHATGAHLASMYSTAPGDTEIPERPEFCGLEKLILTLLRELWLSLWK